MNYVSALAQKIRSGVPTSKLPDGDLDCLFLIYALLALAKGVKTTRRDVHDAWVTWMTIQGKRHDSMRPYDELSLDVQEEDSPYLAAIHSAVQAA